MSCTRDNFRDTRRGVTIIQSQYSGTVCDQATHLCLTPADHATTMWEIVAAQHDQDSDIIVYRILYL